jgi:hypothetical protein
MNKEIEPCVQLVEQLLRGAVPAGSIAVDLRKKAVNLLSWYSTSQAIDEFESCGDSEKSDALAMAVKLHNKSRNLTSPVHAEIRTSLKATSAWMLSLYGGDKIKVLSAVISILSKSGEELSLIDDHDHAELAVKCLSGAVIYWNRVVALSLHKTLSPIELQDMKLAAFYAYLEKAKLIWHRGGSVPEIKKAISGAAELMQTLPPRAKLTFAERVIAITKDMAQSSKLLEETIHNFKLALNAVDSALLPSTGCDMDAECGGGEGANTTLTQAADARILRLHLQLSLAFLYMQAK